MSELDFDRSLPPKMPYRGDDFCAQVAALEELAAGDEEILSTALVEVPHGNGYFEGFVLIEYPRSGTDG